MPKKNVVITRVIPVTPTDIDLLPSKMNQAIAAEAFSRKNRQYQNANTPPIDCLYCLLLRILSRVTSKQWMVAKAATSITSRTEQDVRFSWRSVTNAKNQWQKKQMQNAQGWSGKFCKEAASRESAPIRLPSTKIFQARKKATARSPRHRLMERSNVLDE